MALSVTAGRLAAGRQATAGWASDDACKIARVRSGDDHRARDKTGRAPASVGAAAFDAWQRQTVLNSLRRSASLALSPREWRDFDTVLEDLASALADDDAEKFGTACADLIDLATERATRLGDKPTVPAPAAVRERINEMVHTLVDVSANDRQSAISPKRAMASAPLRDSSHS